VAKIKIGLFNFQIFEKKIRRPIVSLRDIVNYEKGINKINSYQGILEGKEQKNFKLGKEKLFPTFFGI
jgi:hypothetical protein